MKMTGVWVPLVLCLAMVSVVSGAQQAPGGGDAVWMHDLATRHEELIKRNGPGTDAALRAKLVAMNASDQGLAGRRPGIRRIRRRRLRWISS
jgi:hypothetical protein